MPGTQNNPGRQFASTNTKLDLLASKLDNQQTQIDAINTTLQAIITQLNGFSPLNVSPPIVYSENTISEDIIIPSGQNGKSLGPIYITPPYSVSVPPTSAWVIEGE